MSSYHAPQSLDAIVELSLWSADPSRDLVILAEGNSSIKVGGRMLVKGSGAEMSQATPSDFVEVDRRPLGELIRRGVASDDQVAAELVEARTWGTRRPSVEALLHVVCQSFDSVNAVLHTHPTPVNALLCSSSAHYLVDGSYFPDQIVSLGHNPLLIPYIDPGLPLAHAAQTLLAEHTASTGAVPKVIYLRNHGMFALGASVREAQQITEMAVKTARVILGAASVGTPEALSAEHARRIHTRPDELLRRNELQSK
jgi:rhamnose utilization protein RhaD (predicted bifunctional aldolase and dehydrogenase)